MQDSIFRFYLNVSIYSSGRCRRHALTHQNICILAETFYEYIMRVM